MQNVSFRDMEEFLDFLTAEELVIVESLRNIILSCLPNCTEKLSYNVPFYKINKNICFVWPASVLWGKKKAYEGVLLGFSYGYLLNDELNYLEKGKRKHVTVKRFENIREIDRDLLKTYIFEAALIDEQFRKII